MTQTKITVRVGDITQQHDCDAIVNSANASMRAGSGVCGAIHRVAGRGLEKFGMPMAPLQIGQAVVTAGFNLPNALVIHVCAPKYRIDLDPPGHLAAAIDNALTLAESHGVKRIAFPAIATGIHGYPIEEAVTIYYKTAQHYLASQVIKEIRFVFTNANDAELLLKHVMTDAELVKLTNPPSPLSEAFLAGDEAGLVQLLALLFSCHRLVCGMDEEEDVSDWDQCSSSWTIEQWYANGGAGETLRNVATNWADAKKVAEQWFQDFPHGCAEQEWWFYRRDELPDPTAISYFRILLFDRLNDARI